MPLRVAVFRPPHARHGTMFELQAALYARLAARPDLEVTVFHDAARPVRFPGLETRAVRSGFGPLAHRLEKSLGLAPYREARDALAGFDVIETSDPTLHAYPRVALEATRRGGGRLVCGSSVSLPAVRTAAARRAPEVMRAAGAVLCVTPAARRRFTALGLMPADDPRAVITGHPVDTAVFHPPASGPGGGRKPVVLTVARLEPAKGLLEALDAFRHAPPPWAWWIAGAGPLRARLAARVRRLGLAGRVRFLGPVPHAALPALYRTASVLLHLPRATPTWEEYFGAVLIEAMASGTAVVSNRTGAIPWVVGDAGRLGPGPPAESLREILEDRALRRDLAERGRARAEARFAIDRVARRVLRAWRGGATRPAPAGTDALSYFSSVS